jgi:hypothetical protein
MTSLFQCSFSDATSVACKVVQRTYDYLKLPFYGVRTGLDGFVQELPTGEVTALPGSPLTTFPVSIATI